MSEEPLVVRARRDAIAAIQFGLSMQAGAYGSDVERASMEAASFVGTLATHVLNLTDALTQDALRPLAEEA